MPKRRRRYEPSEEGLADVISDVANGEVSLLEGLLSFGGSVAKRKREQREQAAMHAEGARRARQAAQGAPPRRRRPQPQQKRQHEDKDEPEIIDAEWKEVPPK